MKLIALLIGLIVERLATQLFHLREFRWLDPMIDAGLGPVSGHGVSGVDAAHGDHVFVGPPVAHDAHRVNRQEDRECLPQLVVPAGGPDLLDHDAVGAAQDPRAARA